MRRFLMAVMVCTLVACGGSDAPTTPTVANVAGSWSLQTINGTGLPFTLGQTGANKTEITGDVLSVSGTGSFTQTTTVRITLNGSVTTQSVADAGTYTVSGTAATFKFNSDGSIGTGAINGNTLTVAENGYVFVYKR